MAPGLNNADHAGANRFDGVTEAMDPNEQMFGIARLKELLTGRLECPLEQLQKCVLEAVETFARGAHQADDLTLLIVRYRATAAAATTDTDVPLSSSSASSSSAAASAGSPAVSSPPASAASS